MEPLRVNRRVVIPAAELEVSFARSGGPGGQNVNKVESKAILRFSIERSATLTEADRALLRERLGPRLTGAGELVIHAARHREQGRNLEDARERLSVLLREGLAQRKQRRDTRPTRGSVERRLGAKRRRSETKRGRREDEE